MRLLDSSTTTEALRKLEGGTRNQRRSSLPGVGSLPLSSRGAVSLQLPEVILMFYVILGCLHLLYTVALPGII